MEQGKLQAQRHQQFKGPVIKCFAHVKMTCPIERTYKFDEFML